MSLPSTTFVIRRADDLVRGRNDPGKAAPEGLDTTQIASVPFFDNLFPLGWRPSWNNEYGLELACVTQQIPHSAGFNPTWSNTQVFYALQTWTPKNPALFFNGND
jgi:hypothetical protein